MSGTKSHHLGEKTGQNLITASWNEITTTALLLYRSQYIIHSSLPPSPTNCIKSHMRPLESRPDFWVGCSGKKWREEEEREREKREMWVVGTLQRAEPLCASLRASSVKDTLRRVNWKYHTREVVSVVRLRLYACHTKLDAPLCLWTHELNTVRLLWAKLLLSNACTHPGCCCCCCCYSMWPKVCGHHSSATLKMIVTVHLESWTHEKTQVAYTSCCKLNRLKIVQLSCFSR